MKSTLSLLILSTFVLSGGVLAEKADERAPSSDKHASPAGLSDYNVTVSADGSAYEWIDATQGTELFSAEGDDVIGQLNWPFNFTVYDSGYSTADVIDVNSNGSLHFDQGGPRSLWVNCGDIPSDIDGQWAAPLGDDLVSSSVWYIVTGDPGSQVLTIEWIGNTEFGGPGVVDMQVNLFEGSNVIVTQTRITSDFDFAGDGVVGINAGDLVRGTQVFCAADGELPSNDFDVEYAPQCPLSMQVNANRPVLQGQSIEVRVMLQHVKQETAFAAPRFAVLDAAGNVVARHSLPRQRFEQWDHRVIRAEIPNNLVPGVYRLVFELEGMAGWSRRETRFLVIN